MAKVVNSEEILESTAKLMLRVFSEDYDARFEEMLVSGGGGNSMFVNVWQKPSKEFIKNRISSQAKKRLADYGYTLETMPHGFLCNNAKGAQKRKANGKELHMDHNPGNVTVLHLIRDRVRAYKNKKGSYEQQLADLKEFIRNVQTLDIITVEQDDIRTLKDDRFTKKQKDMMSSKERDELLGDDFEELGPGFKYKF